MFVCNVRVCACVIVCGVHVKCECVMFVYVHVGV